MTHNVPNILPEEAGGPVYIGTNFSSQYVFNDGGNTTNAHLAGATDHRGALAFVWKVIVNPNAPGAVGSAGVLSKPPAAGGDTKGFSIWDINSTGAIVGASQLFPAPDTVVDNCNGFAWDQDLNGDGVNWVEFDHYRSQTAFRGGTSQLALGVNPDGERLAGAVAYRNGGVTDAENGIIALNRDATGGVNWSLVAYNGDFNQVFTPGGRGKAVLDGPGGSPVGFISTMLELTDGDDLGPSLSAPSLDSKGNFWFLAPVDYVTDPAAPVDPANIDVTLIRAVYGETADGLPCWELEAVLRNGTVVTGENSGVPYRVGLASFSIVDGNSVSSGTFWSQNVIEQPFFNIDPATIEPRDNRSTHGVLINVPVTYDTDGDGMFSFDSEDAGNGDEEYNVVLFLGPDVCEAGVPCDPTCADATGDGVVNLNDLNAVLSGFNTAQNPGEGGDVNCDGFVDINDLNLVLSQFNTSCMN